MDLLSTNNVKILKSCSKNPSVTDDLWNALLEFSFDTILNEVDIDPAKKFSKYSSINIKAMHAAVVALILESAKIDIQNDQLNMVLDDCGFSAQMKEEFITQFDQHRSNLRAHLHNIGFRSPHVVDLNWRLDYNIKKNQLHKVDELQYTISLTMADNEQIEFVCSREELQDFSAKLKEAAKAIERASQV